MDLTKIINEIQSSNLDSGITTVVCKAVQEYYKVLAAAGAVKKASVKKEEMEQVVEEVAVAGEEPIKITKSKKKAKAKK